MHILVDERTPDAAALLAKAQGVKKVDLIEETGTDGMARATIRLTFDDSAGGSVSDLPNILINNGFRLRKFDEEPVNLETAFMRLTKGIVH